MDCTDTLVETWATSVVKFSSEFNSTTWAAENIVGPPSVFPKHGDYEGTWSQSQFTENEFIEVKFPAPLYVLSLHIFETMNAGNVTKIEFRNLSGDLITVFRNKKPITLLFSRRFMPEITMCKFKTDRVRITLDCLAAKGWCQIDAIKLIGRDDKPGPSLNPLQMAALRPYTRRHSEEIHMIRSIIKQEKTTETRVCLADIARISREIEKRSHEELKLLHQVLYLVDGQIPENRRRRILQFDGFLFTKDSPHFQNRHKFLLRAKVREVKQNISGILFTSKWTTKESMTELILKFLMKPYDTTKSRPGEMPSIPANSLKTAVAPKSSQLKRTPPNLKLRKLPANYASRLLNFSETTEENSLTRQTQSTEKKGDNSNIPNIKSEKCSVTKSRARPLFIDLVEDSTDEDLPRVLDEIPMKKRLATIHKESIETKNQFISDAATSELRQAKSDSSNRVICRLCKVKVVNREESCKEHLQSQVHMLMLNEFIHHNFAIPTPMLGVSQE